MDSPIWWKFWYYLSVVILFYLHISFLSREKVQKALWFAETYGLNLKSLSKEDPSGYPVSIDFLSNTCTSADQNKKPYANLDDKEKEDIKTVLFIMDRFSISLEGKS